MVDEAERAIVDALSVVSDVTENNRIVAGGGAVEIEVAKELRRYANKVGGREQLAVEAFADAMEIVPRALTENAGFEPIDVLIELRTAHDKEDGKYKGLNVFTGKVQNSLENGVVEPLVVKIQAIKSAVESAGGTLDDIVALRIYVVRETDQTFEPVGTALRERFPKDPPASTWIGVLSLAVPEFLIEIEAVAVLD